MRQRHISVLSVAYPLIPTGPDAVGGAEQILTQIDRALVEAGHDSIVVACEGSRTLGTLLTTPLPGGEWDNTVKGWVEAVHQQRILEALDRFPVDVIHLHSPELYPYLPANGIPALITLHGPPDQYPDEIWHLPRPQTYLNCVSASQEAACPADAQNLLPFIENGVPVTRLGARSHAKRGYALALGRICPEKNFHAALDAGTRAGIPVLLAGEVLPYETDMAYYRQEIAPRVGPGTPHRFLGPVSFIRKRRLLAGARCVLLPTLAPETGPLVVREALACGTPVVAFPSGEISKTIEQDRTGFLVNSVEEMAQAIARADKIDPKRCRATARERFSLERMTGRYLAAYQEIVIRAALAAATDAEDELVRAHSA